MPGWRILIAMVATMSLGQSAAAEDFLAGSRLYKDVTQYAAFGLHRFGSPGDKATSDWIASELTTAGFRVEFQPVTLGRQYVVERAAAETAGTTVDATPFWWPPEDKASFRLSAPLVRDGDVAGKILWVELPYDRAGRLTRVGKGCRRFVDCGVLAPGLQLLHGRGRAPPAHAAAMLQPCGVAAMTAHGYA